MSECVRVYVCAFVLRGVHVMCAAYAYMSLFYVVLNGVFSLSLTPHTDDRKCTYDVFRSAALIAKERTSNILPSVS